MSPTGASPRRCLEHWTITGEVLLIGEPSAPVRLAGFYTGCHDFFYVSQGTPACTPALLVSDVAALGCDGGEFSLCFDVSCIHPAAGHYIYLILWADQNGNGEYDPGEDWKYVIPLYDDRVFAGATDCVYYFADRVDQDKGTQPGWNQSAGLEQYVPVDQAGHEGARLANETAWQARSPLPGGGMEPPTAAKGLDLNSVSGIDFRRSHGDFSGGLAQLVERQVRNL
jgi:hypothetical protein